MLIAALVATAATLLAVELVSHVLKRARVYDDPTDRSSHQKRTLRGGGLGAVLGALVAIAVSVSDLDAVPWAGAVATIVAFSLLGLTDDVRPISAKVRLAAQVVIGLSAFIWLPDFESDALPQLALAGGSVFLLVAFVNAFNFMDGINGISAASAIVAGAGFALMGGIEDLTWLQYLGAIVAGAGAGFLPHNFPTARIFLGDSGSYFFGGAISILSILAMTAGVHPVAAVAPLWIYLADTGLTLIRRFRRGENVFEAHRQHTYQRLTDSGAGPHGALAIVTLANLAVVLLGLLASDRSTGFQLLVLAAIAVVTTIYLRSPKLSAPSEAAGAPAPDSDPRSSRSIPPASPVSSVSSTKPISPVFKRTEGAERR